MTIAAHDDAGETAAHVEVELLGAVAEGIVVDVESAFEIEEKSAGGNLSVGERGAVH